MHASGYEDDGRSGFQEHLLPANACKNVGVCSQEDILEAQIDKKRRVSRQQSRDSENSTDEGEDLNL